MAGSTAVLGADHPCTRKAREKLDWVMQQDSGSESVQSEKEQEEGKESEKRHTRALAFSPSLQNGFEIIRNGHNMNTDSDGSR